jgi:hypothetical protein
MTDELRAAAERRRTTPYRDGWLVADANSLPLKQRIEDANLLADAWLAEHDETPVTREWLQTVTFPKGAITLPDWVRGRLTTRGQYRRFYAALGIEVREHETTPGGAA